MSKYSWKIIYYYYNFCTSASSIDDSHILIKADHWAQTFIRRNVVFLWKRLLVISDARSQVVIIYQFCVIEFLYFVDFSQSKLVNLFVLSALELFIRGKNL